ncbi:hypothetical protein BB561_003835 [Smittium simulii]|uniref:Uncharacterized protein n=1 Tax=Smittium simulii TaxID=133385 RepID=A0A2T9YJF7_9FUNG|nr:hypothetical protein BB561_003835 [Smittium simulii]
MYNDLENKNISNISLFQKLGYPFLEQNWMFIVGFTLFFATIDKFSYLILSLISSDKSQKISRKKKASWGGHCISYIHALVVVPLSFGILLYPTITDPVKGFDPRIITLTNYSSG